MKNIFKIVGILILLLLTLLISIPLVLESKIDHIIQNYVEKNIDADVSFNDISLSLISSFPNAEIHIDNLKVNNRSPFEGETLATAKDLSFEMGIAELLKGSEEPLKVNELMARELLLTIKTNATGSVNYDIMKASAIDSNETDSDSAGFSFDLKNYEIINSAFTYIDEENKSALYITEFNHSGQGLFSQSLSQIETTTEAKLSMSIDSVEYLRNTDIKLEALIELDLKENKFSFKDNKGFINALPLEFEGFIKLLENGQQLDISFKNPESTFKDLLAVIPETYSNSFENLTTTGSFVMKGKIVGLLSEETIPNLDITLTSDKASFKYPNLPKSVKNIKINASVINNTGLSSDTYIDINQFNFQIDEDLFRAEAHIKDLTSNLKVEAILNGVINLANLTKAYPLQLETQLSGIITGHLNTKFDMDAINTDAYQRIQNNGKVSISNLIFTSEDFKNPVQINTADLSFKPGVLSLKKCNIQTGISDFTANGTITNLLGFLFSDKSLQGNFNVDSNTFVLSDVMSDNEAVKVDSLNTSYKGDTLKIPAFLDCTVSANARTVIYDNLNLTNVRGQFRIVEQKAILSNLTTDIFKGQLTAAGQISTEEAQPDFDLKLEMKQFDISQSFSDLKMLKALAPIAEVLEGELNASIDVNGILDSQFSPDLNSISGQAATEILSSKVNTDQSPILTELSTNLDFMNLNDFDIGDLKTTLKFENGTVALNPFVINYKDIPIKVSGSHSFTNRINYTLDLQVPARYLGSDINRLIGQINESEVDNITLPVRANIDGTFNKPNITTDVSSGIKDLTQQLIAIQKQKLVGSGKAKVNDLVGDLLGGDKTDATKTKSTKDSSTTESSSLKKEAESILGSLLKGKKTSAKTKSQDSIKKNE